MDSTKDFSKPIEDRAFGKGKFGGFKKAEDFAAIVSRNRDIPEFEPLVKENGNVDVEGERRAAVVTRYRSGSITETHLDPDGSLGNHGAYHFSKRENTQYALKEGGKPPGTAVRSKLI